MDNLDIDNIWNAGQAKTSIPQRSVEETAKKYRGKSIQLVERIRQTAQGEHRIFLTLAALGSIYLVKEQFYYYLLGLIIFTILIIWKYTAEMAMLKKINFQHDTFKYLSAVKGLLNKFMRIYQTGILFLLPGITLGAALIVQGQQGKSIMLMLTDMVFWLIFLITAVVAILAAQLFLKLWVHTLYGRKLKEMDEMLAEFIG